MPNAVFVKKLLEYAKELLAHDLFLSEKEKKSRCVKLGKCDIVAIRGFISVMEAHNKAFRAVLEKAFKNDKKGKFWAKWVSYKKKAEKVIAESVHEEEDVEADKNLEKELQKI